VLFQITDRLASRDDVKNYSVELPNSGRISLNFSHDYFNRSDTFWRITLFDSNQKIMLQIDVTGRETNKDSRYNYLSAGKYSVRVESRANNNNIFNLGGSNNYVLTVNYTENTGQFEIEPNDTRETATEMSVNRGITGNLFERGDIDFYTFSLANPGRVALNFSHEYFNRNDTFWRITLFNSNQKIMLQMDVAGSEANKDSRYNYLSAGKYWVQVESRTNNSNIFNLGGFLDYVLTVNYTENTGQFEIEPNDTRETATKMSVNRGITGNLFERGDIDFYTFTLTNPDRVSLSFSHDFFDRSDNFWRITLFDSNQKITLQMDVTGREANKTSTYSDLNAGRYWVQVESRTGNVNIYNLGGYLDYTLTVNAPNQPDSSTNDPDPRPLTTNPLDSASDWARAGITAAFRKRVCPCGHTG
jgi:hypothetical protein